VPADPGELDAKGAGKTRCSQVRSLDSPASTCRRLGARSPVAIGLADSAQVAAARIRALRIRAGATQGLSCAASRGGGPSSADKSVCPPARLIGGFRRGSLISDWRAGGSSELATKRKTSHPPTSLSHRDRIGRERSAEMPELAGSDFDFVCQTR
jgi:hypothetical protein